MNRYVYIPYLRIVGYLIQQYRQFALISIPDSNGKWDGIHEDHVLIALTEFRKHQGETS